MIGLPYSEKNYDDMLSRFHMVPERNGWTDGQTDRQICYINIARQYADERLTLYMWLRESYTHWSFRFLEQSSTKTIAES